MTHQQLREKVLKAMGGKPPMAARERFGDFIRSEATEITLRYEWIRDGRFYQWIYESPEVDFGEGAETVTVFIVQLGREGH